MNPPLSIFIKSIKNFLALCSALVELGVNNFVGKSTTNRLKLQTANPIAYRKLIHYLKAEKAEYHTYQLKEDKPLCVVIRNLNPSTPLDLIKEELKVCLFEVKQVNQFYIKKYDSKISI